LSRQEPWSGREAALQLAFAAEPTHAPEEGFRYSDINFILLGALVESVEGMPLSEVAQRRIFDPLGMRDTGFATPFDSRWRERVAATERDEEGHMLRGVVHDPTARRMGGVAGHAGVFTTAADVANYARCLLNGGELEGARILQAETVRQMTALATPKELSEKRALGWDLDTSYSRPRGGFPLGVSYGHTGFTGCCLWIDPTSKCFFVLLSNRLHETDRDADSRELYAVLGRHAAESAGYAPAGPGNPRAR
jgi:CubicO group peptidase (beta-lactamase class C family)